MESELDNIKDVSSNKVYNVKRKLFNGDFSDVYLVEDEITKKIYALKLLKGYFFYGLEDMEKYIQEIEFIKRIKHKHIIEYIDHFYDKSGCPCILTKYYQTDLNALIIENKEKKEKFNEILLARWLIQILKGLEYLHFQNIVHRDIKPKNIYLNDGLAIIGDLGLARVVNKIRTSSRFFGTINYLSPECISAEKIECVSDMWSFGCLLYESLEFEKAFDGEGEFGIFEAIIRKPIPAINHWFFDSILKKCLERDPKNRSSANDLIEIINKNYESEFDHEFKLDINSRIKEDSLNRDYLECLVGNVDLTTTIIDLSNKNIKKLDNQVFHGLNNLIKLDLNANQIESLDSATFSSLYHLQYLYLENNKLNKIETNTFSSLCQLKMLSLNDNNLTYLDTNAFNGLANLEKLNLYNNNLEDLDCDLFKSLLNLKELFLHNNKLTTIKVGLFKGLFNLEKLGLHFNNIESIENNLFNDLTGLRWLYLENNQIKSLQCDTFKNVARLQKLSLYNNKIDSVETGAFNGLSSVQEIWLNYNQIARLDTNLFHGLGSLQTLSLYSNKLVEIHPNTFKELINLQRLHLDNNMIVKIDLDTFNSLVNLKLLYLDNNKLACLDIDMFKDLKSLECLSVESNKQLVDSNFITNLKKLIPNCIVKGSIG